MHPSSWFANVSILSLATHTGVMLAKSLPALPKKIETAENHDIYRTLFDRVIPRSITND